MVIACSQSKPSWHQQLIVHSGLLTVIFVAPKHYALHLLFTVITCLPLFSINFKLKIVQIFFSTIEEYERLSVGSTEPNPQGEEYYDASSWFSKV